MVLIVGNHMGFQAKLVGIETLLKVVLGLQTRWFISQILEWSTVVLIVGYLFFLVGFFLLARSLRSLACLSLDLKVSLLVIPSLRSVIF